MLFSALCSGLEIAFVSSNRLRITLEKQQGKFSGKLLAKFVENPALLIATLLIGNNIALVVYSISMSAVLMPFLAKVLPISFQSESWLFVFQTLIATIVILFTGEFLPKASFRINPNQILNFFALPLKLLFYVLFPIVRFFVGISNFVLRFVFRINVNRLQPINFTTIDLDAYLSEIETDESSSEEVKQGIQLFQNAIEFKDLKVRECMVPRTEIIALEETESLEVLKETIIESGHSKILLYQGNVDNIVGYAHSYDLYKRPEQIKSITRPVLIIPESMPANTLMGILLKKHKSVAVVVDEFGGTAGMITMEDILEEIIGDIRDEFDTEELIEKELGPNEWIFSARHEIDYLNGKYKLEFPESDEYETLAGFIIHMHESIPKQEEKVFIGAYTFTIIQATDARIELVKLEINQNIFYD
jgi:putative hemolysin